MVVVTDDIDYVEDMFTRLNEAVPLNAAEKRNSFGGPLPRITRQLVQHEFFTDRTKISSTRYRHHDLVAKMLWLAWATPTLKLIPDTKKETLDAFYRSFRAKSEEDLGMASQVTVSALDDMASIFGRKDDLLRSPAVMPVYFLLFQQLRIAGSPAVVTRKQLEAFERERDENRTRLILDEEGVDARLIEYDELAQSSNDAASIGVRLDTLRKHLGLPDFSYPG